MTVFGPLNELAALLVPTGWIGAALAAACDLVAGIATARGAAGLSGGAAGVWFPFALLSLTASIANQWMPVLTALAALAVCLVLGGIGRGFTAAAERHRTAPVASVASVVPVVPGSSGAVVASSAVVSPRVSEAPRTAPVAVRPAAIAVPQ